jgi:hypothetical protein
MFNCGLGPGNTRPCVDDRAIDWIFVERMEGSRGAFGLAQASTPMMSLSFMIRSSSPSSLTSVPDHLPKQHAVADLEVDRNQLAGFVTAARAHCGDFALRGLLSGGIGDDDAALGLFLGVDALDHDAVV